VSVSQQRMRALKGKIVRLTLTSAEGGGELRGLVVSCLESADGLVVYINDETGRTRTLHYQHIAEAEPAS